MSPEEAQVLKDALQFSEWLKDRYDGSIARNGELERQIMLLKTEIKQLKHRSASVSSTSVASKTVSRKSSCFGPNFDPELLREKSMEQTLSYQRDMAILRDTIAKQEIELKQYHELIYLFKQPQMPFDIKVMKRDGNQLNETRQWLRNTFGYVDAKKYASRKAENEVLWHAYRKLAMEHANYLQVPEGLKTAFQDKLLAKILQPAVKRQYSHTSSQVEASVVPRVNYDQSCQTDPFDLKKVDRVQFIQEQIQKLGQDEWITLHDSALKWTSNSLPAASYSVSTQVEVSSYSISVATDANDSFVIATQSEIIEPDRCDSNVQVSSSSIDSSVQTYPEEYEKAAQASGTILEAHISGTELQLAVVELPAPLEISPVEKHTAISSMELNCIECEDVEDISCDSPLSLVSIETRCESNVSEPTAEDSTVVSTVGLQIEKEVSPTQSCCRNVSVVDSAIDVDMGHGQSASDYEWDYDPITDQFVRTPKEKAQSSKNVDHFINTWNSSVRSW